MMHPLAKIAIGIVLISPAALHSQESVCDLFSDLEKADGQKLTLTGDLIISADTALLGATDCDNRYVNSSRRWPTAVALRPSSTVAPSQLLQFKNAAAEADYLRTQGKIVSASATFSGQIRVAVVNDQAAELIFDSFENLKVETLPDASSLKPIPICDLFQNLQAWRGKRIAVRGELVGTMEGTWIYGGCKSGFITDGFRWRVALSFGAPAYYSAQTAKIYEPRAAALTDHQPSQQELAQTATLVGILRLRSDYHIGCGPNGRYRGFGFGHLNGAAGELIVDTILNVEPTPRPDFHPGPDDMPQRCTPPDLATLCSKADSLVSAAAVGCPDRVRDFLAKDGIDSKNGSESMSLRAAIRSGNESIVKLLLNAGATLDPLEATRSPLAEAALDGKTEILKLLLASGARVESLDHHGIAFLPDSGVLNPRVIEVLLESGTNVNATNANGETILMKASAGAAQTVKVLIEHHADLNLKDNKGRTALMHAAAGSFSNTIPLLLENGADFNLRDNAGKTALDLADASNNLGAIAMLSVATKRLH
jgi:Ankyrin repeats (3 copies)